MVRIAISLGNLLFDGPNLIAGIYKGAMNAQGHEVDPTYLLYVGTGTAVTRGAVHGIGLASLKSSRRLEKRLEQVAEELKQNNPADAVDAYIARVRAGHEQTMAGVNPTYEGTKKVAKSTPLAFLEMLVGYTIGYMSAKLIQ